MANYPLIPGTLASDCWPASPQSFYNEMFAKGYVQLSINGVVKSATTPAVAERSNLWVKLNGGGQPTGYFIYVSGQWIQPHPTPASSSERRLWVGAEADLETYDGGTAGAVSAVSGPFWEVDDNFAAKFPVGPGTMAGGTVIGVTGTGGEDEHVLTEAELAAHTHTMNFQRSKPDTGPDELFSTGNGGLTGDYADLLKTSSSTGGGEAHNTLPPYYGCFIIKRTARIFFVG